MLAQSRRFWRRSRSGIGGASGSVWHTTALFDDAETARDGIGRWFESGIPLQISKKHAGLRSPAQRHRDEPGGGKNTVTLRTSHNPLTLPAKMT